MCLTPGSETNCEDSKAVSTLTTTAPVSKPIRDRTPFQPQHDLNDHWTTVNTMVIGDHEIPHRVAMHIPVSVLQATVGCDICLEGPSHIKRLVVESTLNTFHEGHKTVALVVGTTGGSIKLRKGVLLTKALVIESLEFPASCLASVYQNTSVNNTASVPTLESCVAVADYPELRYSLLELLRIYRNVIDLPAETLGTTGSTEHHIKLKPGIQSLYSRPNK